MYMLIIQTAVLASIFIGIYKLVAFLRYIHFIVKACEGLPGPKEKHWLFGSFVAFPKDNVDKVKHYIDITNKYGAKGFFLLWGLLKKPVIVCCSPKYIGNILKTSEPKTLGLVGAYRFLSPWLGPGLLIAGGKKWARNRRLLTPAFHFDILKPYVKIYNESTDVLLDKIDQCSDKRERFEICHLISLCTLDTILKCAFSYEEDVQSRGLDNPYIEAVTRITDNVVNRFLNPLYFIDFFWKRSKPGLQFTKDCNYVHSVAEDLIGKRRKALQESSTLSSTPSKYLDFLDILLTARDENNEGLSALEIRHEVDTFLFEGHDTTASAIFWILYSLAKHQEYQQSCQLEIDEILKGRDSEVIKWSDLPNLEYLTMCIKEGLRLHAPVPIVSRETEEEFDLEDRKLPKGVIIQINVFAAHHNEKYWPDHMTYNPERFSKENILKIEPFQFVPFAGGPRNCIGQNFAMNEIKVVVAKILKRFTLTLDPDHSVRQYMSGVMRSENGIYMFAERRK